MITKESTQDFIKQCKRVLHVAKKPDRDEYINVSKITAIGIIIIGLVGFVISIGAQLLRLAA